MIFCTVSLSVLVFFTTATDRFVSTCQMLAAYLMRLISVSTLVIRWLTVVEYMLGFMLIYVDLTLISSSFLWGNFKLPLGSLMNLLIQKIIQCFALNILINVEINARAAIDVIIS